MPYRERLYKLAQSLKEHEVLEIKKPAKGKLSIIKKRVDKYDFDLPNDEEENIISTVK